MMNYTAIRFIQIIILGAILCFNTEVFAQKDTAKVHGVILVEADPLIMQLLNAEVEYMKENPVMSGFRIQIIEAPRRAEVFKKQGEVLRVFPDVKSYVVYQQPSFKLRVGDYYNRLEALKMLNEIQKHFPAAFVIRDNVQIHEPTNPFDD
ncbi:MAG: SPOR domain-containing protein [Chitinophagaceae bacterium]|nr:MAG: SPOR domain-containing protein [Chitinophagaceae bacterium]